MRRAISPCDLSAYVEICYSLHNTLFRKNKYAMNWKLINEYLEGILIFSSEILLVFPNDPINKFPVGNSRPISSTI